MKQAIASLKGQKGSSRKKRKSQPKKGEKVGKKEISGKVQGRTARTAVRKRGDRFSTQGSLFEGGEGTKSVKKKSGFFARVHHKKKMCSLKNVDPHEKGAEKNGSWEKKTPIGPAQEGCKTRKGG